VTTGDDDRWVAGDAYEAYMGRWSRLLAREFIGWLQPARTSAWLEVGCGTGALTSTIALSCEPASIVACDPSAPFVEHARAHLRDPRVSFVVGGAEALPQRPQGFDFAVSGLVLNFITDVASTMTAIRSRLRPGGVMAAYVWDYADGMEFLRIFWEDAVGLDSRATAVDERRRFPLCDPSALASLLEHAGFTGVETQALEIATEFTNFDDYWAPFLQGTGPAPSYVASLHAHEREQLRRRLEHRLSQGGQPIRLGARAWTVRGTT
jgi:trans-aconitate methyltransferase